jgi:hypothetical protein
LQLEISHLNSTVVSGYRTLLVKDSILEQRLAALRSPVRRTLRVYGIVLLYAAVLCFCILERGFFGFIWMAVATAIFAQSLLRFKRERAIVASYGKAVGPFLCGKKQGGEEGYALSMVSFRPVKTYNSVRSGAHRSCLKKDKHWPFFMRSTILR